MSRIRLLARRCTADPRHHQIATLSSLLLYGVIGLEIDLNLLTICWVLAFCMATQVVAGRMTGVAPFDFRSPLISGLSLSLLLRTDSLALAALASMFTISSKFLFRRRGKHIFNPTNFGLVAMMLLTDAVWVSHGQWGSAAFFGFALACLGGLVIHRAERSDVTYAFLISYLGIVFGRALWLGDPITIPLHQVQSGAFLIFAFFMISDPRTTPSSRTGRIAFAVLVASGAAAFQFLRFDPNGLLWSLALFALTVPLLDKVFPGRRFEWRRSQPAPNPLMGGESDETWIHRVRPVRDLWAAARTARGGVLWLLRSEGRRQAL